MKNRNLIYLYIFSQKEDETHTLVVAFFCTRCGWKFDWRCALLGIRLHEANCATKKPKYIATCHLCGMVSWDRILIEDICQKKNLPPKKRVFSISFLSSPGVWWHWEVKTGGRFVAESVRRKEKNNLMIF